MPEDRIFSFGALFRQMDNDEADVKVLEVAEKFLRMVEKEMGGENVLRKTYERLDRHQPAARAFIVLMDIAMTAILNHTVSIAEAAKSMAKLLTEDLTEAGIQRLQDKVDARYARLEAQGLNPEEIARVGIKEILAEAGVDVEGLNDSDLDALITDGDNALGITRRRRSSLKKHDFTPKWEKI